MRKLIENRIWDKVDKIKDGCWNWTGSLSNGYGKINSGGSCGHPLRAHRVIYELLVGKIPTGMVIDHLCKNRKCVNPVHMEVVTQKENVNRGKISIRLKTGKCRRGHLLVGKNLYMRKDRIGSWNCLACIYLLRKKYKKI